MDCRADKILSFESREKAVKDSFFGFTIKCCVSRRTAPAAYDTISAFFGDTGTRPEDYDMILTGDLASVGKEILIDAFNDDGIDISGVYEDCGMLIYDTEKQDVHAGGSGCGCSASVLCGYILGGMLQGRWNHILFCATGALMSPVALQQGESIPSICHLIEIENGGQ